MILLYIWHAAPERYLTASISVANVLPVLVPSLGKCINPESLLARVDGVLITGSRSNVHPSLYGQKPDKKHQPFDTRRDATTLPLIRRTIEAGVPLFAICRGIQEMNVARGGSLLAELQEREGALDHRGQGITLDEQFALRHNVTIQPGRLLASILNKTVVPVNSAHRQGIDRLGQGLQVEAVAPDGNIEAVSVADAQTFALGVQWHPEYWVENDITSRQIFEAFGEAVHKHAHNRQGR